MSGRCTDVRGIMAAALCDPPARRQTRCAAAARSRSPASGRTSQEQQRETKQQVRVHAAFDKYSMHLALARARRAPAIDNRL